MPTNRLSSAAVRDRIAEAIRQADRPMTAREIGRLLELPRSDVNSVLFQHVGEIFLRSGEDRPRWRLVESAVAVTEVRSDFVNLQHQSTGPIHVDFQGGDWTIEVRSAPMSRNDPPFILERTGL